MATVVAAIISFMLSLTVCNTALSLGIPTPGTDAPLPPKPPVYANSAEEAREFISDLPLNETDKNRLLEQPFLYSWEYADNSILEKIALAAADSDRMNELREFMDRTWIYDIGSPAIPVHDGMPTGTPPLRHITRHFGTPLGNSLTISVVTTDKKDYNIAVSAAEAVRTAEKLIGRPLPVKQVIIAIAPTGYEAAGVNYGTHIAIDPLYASPSHPRRERIISHEVVHYWFRGNHELIDEGIAELAAAITSAVDGEPQAYQGPGMYGRGEACMLALYQAAGPAGFANAAGSLYDQSQIEDYADEFQGTYLTLEHLEDAFASYPKALAQCQ